MLCNLRGFISTDFLFFRLFLRMGFFGRCGTVSIGKIKLCICLCFNLQFWYFKIARELFLRHLGTTLVSMTNPRNTIKDNTRINFNYCPKAWRSKLSKLNYQEIQHCEQFSHLSLNPQKVEKLISHQKFLYFENWKFNWITFIKLLESKINLN
jgi:hypothetical protein